MYLSIDNYGASLKKPKPMFVLTKKEMVKTEFKKSNEMTTKEELKKIKQYRNKYQAIYWLTIVFGIKIILLVIWTILLLIYINLNIDSSLVKKAIWNLYSKAVLTWTTIYITYGFLWYTGIDFIIDSAPFW